MAHCADMPPNVLIIIGDDCTFTDLSIHGGTNVQTPNIGRHVMGRSEHNPYWSTWMYDAPVNPHTYAMIQRFVHRPQEDLYRAGEEPFEMNNLAKDPQYAEFKQRLSFELDRWMAEQGDPGMKLDTRNAWNQRRKAAGLKIKNE